MCSNKTDTSVVTKSVNYDKKYIFTTNNCEKFNERKCWIDIRPIFGLQNKLLNK